MTAETLKHIKEEIGKFLIVVDGLKDSFKETSNTTGLTTITVLVQNMAFNAIHCQGYIHQVAVTELRNNLNTLRLIKEYANSHVEDYIHDQIDMIITGSEMSEVEEESTSWDTHMV